MSNSHTDTNRTIFLGAGARIARPVIAEWANFCPSGTLHTLSRVDWDMRAAPPPRHFATPPVVVCFAGITPRRGADLTDNTALALAAQAAGLAWNACHVFHLSSAAVYGDPGPRPVAEIPDPMPIGAYGAAKLAMEHALADDPPHTVLRLGNVAGAGQPFDAALGPKAPHLHRFADGQGPVRSYIGPRSLTRVLAVLTHLAQTGAPLPRLLNVAAPQPTAMADILTALGRDWTWIDAPPEAIQTVHLDTTRLAALCALPPHSGTAAGLLSELHMEITSQ